MAKDDKPAPLPPMVVQVIYQFHAAIRADDAIDDAAADRLDKLLRKGSVAKPDEINAALFEPTAEDHE